MKVTASKIKALLSQVSVRFHQVEGTTLTACWAFLPDGFQVGYGQSCCVDPKEFDEDIGREIAHSNCMADAEKELWKMEGYLLKQGVK